MNSEEILREAVIQFHKMELEALPSDSYLAERQEVSPEFHRKMVRLINGGHTVGAVIIRIKLHPLGGEPQHPAVETVHPYRVFGHPAGECGYPVRSVPFGEVLKVGGEGMVFADAARAHKALDVPVPAVYACFDGFHTERVHPSLVHLGVEIGRAHV